MSDYYDDEYDEEYTQVAYDDDYGEGGNDGDDGDDGDYGDKNGDDGDYGDGGEGGDYNGEGEGGEKTEFKGSYADKERTGGGGMKTQGVYVSPEEKFMMSLSSEYRNVSNESNYDWTYLNSVPNLYYMNPFVLAVAIYAFNNRDNPDFSPPKNDKERDAHVVNKVTDDIKNTGKNINVIDVFRYYTILQQTFK